MVLEHMICVSFTKQLIVLKVDYDIYIYILYIYIYIYTYIYIYYDIMS